jgi:hypothetical protein
MNYRNILFILMLMPTFHACSHKPALKHDKHTKLVKKNKTELATVTMLKPWINRDNK